MIYREAGAPTRISRMTGALGSVTFAAVRFPRAYVREATLLFWLPLAASAQEPVPYLQVQWENDAFLKGRTTDRWYTNGTRFTWMTRNSDEPAFDAHLQSLLLGDWATRRARRFMNGEGWFFEQLMYTPRAIGVAAEQLFDRPWAGWLQLGRVYQGAIEAERWGASRPVHRLAEVSIGTVGPSARAEQTQTWVHRLVGATKPLGWSHQIHDEVTANLTYRETAKLGSDTADALIHHGYNVGNAQIYGNAGGTLRAGHNLCDFGLRTLPATAPLVRNAAEERPHNGECSDPVVLRSSSWYLSAGFDVRLVVRNITLDGNSFRDSPSIAKKPIVGDAVFAAAWRRDGWTAAYLVTIRSPEFSGQRGAQRFGSFVLSVPI